MFSDYARPAAATASGSYRPAKPAVNEDDFMASLLSTVTAEPSRKRKSSPDYPPSSDPVMPSSDSGFFSSGSVRKRYGDSSDDESWDPLRGKMGKKPRVSDVTVKPEPQSPDQGVDFAMEMDDGHDDVSFVKPEPIDDDDEETNVKPAARRSGPAPTARRRMVNSTAVKYVKKEPESKLAAQAELEARKPVLGRKQAPDRAHWQSVQAALVPSQSDIDAVRVPQGSTKAENVLEDDGSLNIFWLDFLDQDGVVHLVGKVLDRQSNRYVSACVSVQGIERNLFVKPRAKRFGKPFLRKLTLTRKQEVARRISRYRRTTCTRSSTTCAPSTASKAGAPNLSNASTHSRTRQSSKARASG